MARTQTQEVNKTPGQKDVPRLLSEAIERPRSWKEVFVKSMPIVVRMSSWRLVEKMEKATKLKPSHLIGFSLRAITGRMARGDYARELREYHLVAERGMERKHTNALISEAEKDAAKRLAKELGANYQSLVDFCIRKYYAEWAEEENVAA